jgi:lysine-specific demethylase/histidyl-hydroxylase NO66
LRERVWPAARPAPLRPLAQAGFAAGLTPADRIAARAGLRWSLTPEGADRVSLRLPDRSISFPAGCAGALSLVLSGSAVRVGDLPGLDSDDDRLVLARRLLREAVAVPG